MYCYIKKFSDFHFNKFSVNYNNFSVVENELVLFFNKK